MLQTGKMGGEAYRAAGITGKGQVCGIADSGLNDLSCFFYDGPSSLSPSSSGSHTSAYRGVLTNRSGLIEPLRRKVIQYIAYADMTDELGETAMRCNETNAMLHNSITCCAMLCLLYCACLFLTSVGLLQTDCVLCAHSNPSDSSLFHVQTSSHNPFSLIIIFHPIAAVLVTTMILTNP